MLCMFVVSLLCSCACCVRALVVFSHKLCSRTSCVRVLVVFAHQVVFERMLCSSACCVCAHVVYARMLCQLYWFVLFLYVGLLVDLFGHFVVRSFVACGFGFCCYLLFVGALVGYY